MPFFLGSMVPWKKVAAYLVLKMCEHMWQFYEFAISGVWIVLHFGILVNPRLLGLLYVVVVFTVANCL